jgi:hypothetical protein
MVETGIEIDNLILLCRADSVSQDHKLVEKVKQNYDLSIIRKVGKKRSLWDSSAAFIIEETLY